MTDIYSLTYEQAEKLLIENGFRATQCANIFRDIYKRKATGIIPTRMGTSCQMNLFYSMT